METKILVVPQFEIWDRTSHTRPSNAIGTITVPIVLTIHACCVKPTTCSTLTTKSRAIIEVQKESQHCESQLHKQTILGIGPKERLQTHNNTGKALGYSSLYGYAVTSLMPGYPCNEKTECSNYDRAFFEEEVYMHTRTGPASLNNRSASLRALNTDSRYLISTSNLPISRLVTFFEFFLSSIAPDFNAANSWRKPASSSFGLSTYHLHERYVTAFNYKLRRYRS
jgi:hypothetical protein